MEGITIVNTIETTKDMGSYWAYEHSFGSVLGIIGLCAFTVFICFLIWKAIDEDEGMFILFALLVLIIIVVLVFGVFQHNITEKIIQQKIIADDTVKLNEFFKQYNVVDREGLIFIVETPIEKDEVK